MKLEKKLVDPEQQDKESIGCSGCGCPATIEFGEYFCDSCYEQRPNGYEEHYWEVKSWGNNNLLT